MDWMVEANVLEKCAVPIFRASALLLTNPHSDLTQKNIIRIVTALKNLKSHTAREDLVNVTCHESFGSCTLNGLHTYDIKAEIAYEEDT
jgi:hypothetical protein